MCPDAIGPLVFCECTACGYTLPIYGGICGGIRCPKCGNPMIRQM